MYYYICYPSMIGDLYVVSDYDSIKGLWLVGEKYFNEDVFIDAMKNEKLPILKEASAWLDDYFDGKRPSPNDIKLSPMGSKFRQQVWKELVDIPYGSVISYGEIANKLAKINKTNPATQAVGGAVSHNPISIIIPCHRVVGKDGNLTGYAGGLDRKIKLLEHEGVDITRLYMPNI